MKALNLTYTFYAGWFIKRYVWQVILLASYVAALLYATWAIQCITGALLGIRLGLDFWNYYSFRAYHLVDSESNKPKTWEAILGEFENSTRALAFHGISRVYIARMIREMVNQGTINQSNNNLCGPIAFLTVLCVHNPALFVKTLCEYYENGSTQAPFYLQSSIWDRYGETFLLNWIYNIFGVNYDIFSNIAEPVAGAFKNTHNLSGYNKGCLLECFKGTTEPKRISQWLDQSGYDSTSNMTVNGYSNEYEMPWLFRTMLGGLYGANNRVSRSRSTTNQPKQDVCYIELSQEKGDSPLHYIFNSSSGHWSYHKKNNSHDNKITVHLHNTPEKQMRNLI